MRSKTIKHLRFELTSQEYSDFWHIAALLEKDKKKDVLLDMMKIVKELKEKVDKE